MMNTLTFLIGVVVFALITLIDLVVGPMESP